MSGAGGDALRWVLAFARSVYGIALSLLPDTTADRLRTLVAPLVSRLPARHLFGHARIRVPGDPEQPVVLVVAVGASARRLRQLHTHLAGVPGRLVWLVDVDRPEVLADQVVEWLPPREALRHAGIDPSMVRRRRLARLEQRYRPRRVVVVGAEGPLPDPELVVPIGEPR